ncbi:MAG: hypothetical protein H6701_07140 [Myxococcales bacterium]|nr:hypothetical protein [Myxococcales bacterium]
MLGGITLMASLLAVSTRPAHAERDAAVSTVEVAGCADLPAAPLGARDAPTIAPLRVDDLPPAPWHLHAGELRLTIDVAAGLPAVQPEQISFQIGAGAPWHRFAILGPTEPCGAGACEETPSVLSSGFRPDDALDPSDAIPVALAQDAGEPVTPRRLCLTLTLRSDPGPAVDDAGIPAPDAAIPAADPPADDCATLPGPAADGFAAFALLLAAITSRRASRERRR